MGKTEPRNRATAVINNRHRRKSLVGGTARGKLVRTRVGKPVFVQETDDANQGTRVTKTQRGADQPSIKSKKKTQPDQGRQKSRRNRKETAMPGGLKGKEGGQPQTAGIQKPMPESASAGRRNGPLTKTSSTVSLFVQGA